ncbi:MAG: hypothetical protein A2V66_10520 [Ignavibacteria bacterium RBG_13_36_8]|nr:MAG: hypothetical protein A2V66_10520 [Ignavibacteria bacterium RBG_13_36_8]
MNIIDGEKLYYGFFSGEKEVLKRRNHLNKINVFPVADGDTGTNLVHTMHSITEGSRAESSVANVSRDMASAALIGSRGNSGIIFAQFLQGVHDSVKDKIELNVKDFVNAAKRGVDFAYMSVTHPVEGTILTVMKSWSDSLHSLHEKTNDFVELISHSIDAAKIALSETPKKLKVLRDAGVVDAGAEGFVHFIEGFLHFIRSGIKPKSSDTEQLALPKEKSHKFDKYKKLEYRYCTEGMVNSTRLTTDQLREMLSEYGESLIVAGSTQVVKFHIHTNNPSEIFYGLRKFGLITQSKVDDMQRQSETQFKRKSSIALVIDSTCDLPQSILDKYQIHLIPINLTCGEHHYLDKLAVTPDQFYSMLDEEGFVFSTSQPPVKTFENFYSSLLEHYDAIISLHLSQVLSGTYNAAKLAAEKFPNEKIAVINTKSISSGAGLMAQRVAEEIERKKSFEEIVALTKTLSAKTHLLVSVKTLKYMVRSGRVSPLKGFIANLLKLKPIVSLDKNGASTLSGKAFSEQANINKIVSKIAEHNKTKPILRYAIGHVHCDKEAVAFSEKIEKAIGKSAEYIMDISPAIGGHVGIGALSVCFIEE